jgi:hypothetical protein
MNCLTGKFLTRTWPYGTQKNVTVVSNDPVPNSGDTYILACLEEETAEGFVLVRRGKGDAWKGDRGVITFKEGGTTGGHWNYEKAKSQSL